MSKILLNSNIKSIKTEKVPLPVVFIRPFVKKSRKPDQLRYAKKQEIHDYAKILTTKSLRFNQRNYISQSFKKPIQIPNFKAKQRVNTLPLITCNIFVQKDESEVIKFEENKVFARKKTPQPKHERFKVMKGQPLSKIFEENEPSFGKFLEKPETRFLLPDVAVIRPSIKIEKKTVENFKFIQENVSNYKASL